jgi:PAS domain S-box-containing protein
MSVLFNKRDETAVPEPGRNGRKRLPSDTLLVARLGERALTAGLTADVLQDAVELLSQRLGCEFVKVLELVPGGEGFLLTTGVGWKPGYVGQVVVPLIPESHAGYTMLQGHPVVVEDLRREKRFRGMPLLHEHGIVSGVSAIIPGRDGPHGIVTAHSAQKRKFSDRDVAFMESVAWVLGAALDAGLMDKSIAEANDRLRLAMEAGRMGTWEWNVKSGEVKWSESLERIHGLKPGTFGGSFEDYASDIHPDDREGVLATVQGSLTGGPHELEYRIIWPDGSLHWLTARGLLIRDDQGEPERMIGICMDVTAQKAADEARRAAEERFQALFQNAVFGVFQTTPGGRFVNANSALARILGFDSPEALMGAVTDIGRQVHVKPARRAEFSRVLEKEGEVHGFESQARRRDGAIIWIALTARAQRDGQGRVVAYEGVVEDITSRKAAEEALAAREAQQAAVARLGQFALERAPLAQLMKAAVRELRDSLHVPFARVLRLLPGGEEFAIAASTGFRKGAAQRVRAGNASQAGYTVITGGPVIVKDLRSETRFETPPILDHHGVVSGVTTVVSSLGAAWGVIGVHTREPRDFTDDELNFLVSVANILSSAIDRDESEQALRDSEARISAVLETAVDGIITIDERGAIQTVNAAVERIFGYTPGELVGNNVNILMPQPDRGRHDGYLRHYMRTGEAKIIGVGREVRGRRKDGSTFPLDLAISEVRLADGKRTFTGIVRDISERKQAEERILEGNALLSAVIEGTTDGVYVKDLEGRYALINTAGAANIGMTPEMVLGKRDADLLPSGVARMIAADDRRVMESGRAQTIEDTISIAEGTRVYSSVKAPYRDAHGRVVGTIGVSRDVTEERRLGQEKELLAEASSILASSLDYEETLSGVASLATRELADVCSVDLVEEAGVRRIALALSPGLKPGPLQSLPPRHSPQNGADHPVIRVVATGRPELHSTLDREVLASAARGRGHLKALRALGLHSAVIVPLEAGGHRLGALTLASRQEGRHGERDLQLAQELARRAGIAIDNAMRYEKEQEARRLAEESAARIERLQAVTAALSESLVPEEVGRVVVAAAMAVLRARSGTVALLGAEGAPLELVAAEGVDGAFAAGWEQFAANPTEEVLAAIRSGRPIYVESGRLLAGLFPSLQAIAGQVDRGFACLPLPVENHVIGAMVLTFDGALPDEAGREFIQALAAQCAQALERTRLFTAERDARRSAQEAEERQAFLARTGAVLSSSLDFEATLSSLARLCVPTLGDWCAIDVLEDHRLQRVAVVHSDPERVEYARRLQEKYPQVEADENTMRVIDKGESLLFREIPEELLVAGALNDEHLELVRGLGLSSAIVVPLRARGRTLGVLTLVQAESGRHYDETGLKLAEELGYRAGLAVDNSRLYSESQRAQEELRVANEAKDEFLGLVSHELRTPITTIYGGARLLRTRSDTLDARSKDGVLEDIETEAERLHRIVEDLLVLARLELGEEISTEPVLVQRIAVRAANALIKLRPSRQVRVEDGDRIPAARASAVYVEQILRNLVNNADKYSPPDKPIDISIRAQGDSVLASVNDRGPGLPPEEIDRIFERFYRASATAKKTGGAGIGLTVCRRLVEAQHGEIGAEPREGGGLRVWFSLPVYRE